MDFLNKQPKKSKRTEESAPSVVAAAPPVEHVLVASTQDNSELLEKISLMQSVQSQMAATMDEGQRKRRHNSQ